MTPRVTALLCAAVLVTAGCGADSRHLGDAARAELDVRERPRSAVDELAPPILASIRTTPLGRRIADPGSSRFLRTVGDRDYYYVEGTNSAVCLAYAGRADGSVGATCAAEEALTGVGVYLAESDTLGAPPRVSLLVADPFDRASDDAVSLPVTANLVVFDELAGTGITLSGPGGRTHRIDLGALVPDSDG